MNRMFFGDARDLFKFDLVRHIMKAFPELGSFTFVPMLTEDEPVSGKKTTRTKDLGLAVKKGRAGTRNRELMEDLGRLQEIDDDLAYFHGIQSYFRKENIVVDVLHRDTFSHEHRENYFKKVFDRFPSSSLVFLDPDTGLEVKNPTQRHLLFDEVKRIFDRMDHQSVLMIYQHLPRVIREGYIRKRCRELASLTHSRPETITDNEIVFFILTKNPQHKTRLCAVLGEYADQYNTLTACDCQGA
ncbi:MULTISPECIES: hypothetical protein [unclassified Methanoregula]|uniref:hypothetical protein n=1 Tax=unclassified Methanoregula TaxID=2649730 RepID=UPI0025DE1B23|nr:MULTISPECIES: hypothetical protein [unclassified Methanoregula]